MPINYERGRNREYYIRNLLIKKGYDIVIRSAGSHSFADLIAINKKTKEILFIQVKPKKFSEKTKEKLFTENNWVNDEFICKFDVM